MTLSILGLIRLGPRDEKYAMKGAGFEPKVVVGNLMFATRDLQLSMSCKE